MIAVAVLLALASVVVLAAYPRLRLAIGRANVEDRLAQHEQAVQQRLAADFARVGAGWPPEMLRIVVLKDARTLLLYARVSAHWRFIRQYPILAASGGPGPKLREGDLQVPEGVYRVESLNPNSRFHLALRVDYPNEQDRAAALADGRDAATLGGDIMIHGSNASVGCVAIGDEAIEDVFVVAARTGLERVELIFSPNNQPTTLVSDKNPAWLAERYRRVEAMLRELPPASP